VGDNCTLRACLPSDLSLPPSCREESTKLGAALEIEIRLAPGFLASVTRRPHTAGSRRFASLPLENTSALITKRKPCLPNDRRTGSGVRGQERLRILPDVVSDPEPDCLGNYHMETRVQCPRCESTPTASPIFAICKCCWNPWHFTHPHLCISSPRSAWRPSRTQENPKS